MKTFEEWLKNEVTFNPGIDGKPLIPKTISGAEVQIRTLASNIRTTFLLDDKFKPFSQEIFAATKLLDQAADLIGKNADDVRNEPHNFA